MLVAYCITSVGLGTFQLFQPKIAPQFGSEDPPLWCFEVAGWALLRRILSFFVFRPKNSSTTASTFEVGHFKDEAMHGVGASRLQSVASDFEFPHGPMGQFVFAMLPRLVC
jgi:hypothetical protein